MNKFQGVNFNNVRKALYIMYFGVDDGACNTFESEKYKYIIPMQNSFDNPIQDANANDTFILYWIDKDTSLTQDDYVIDENNNGWNRQKCVAEIYLRFVGKEAEDWAKVFRHVIKRKTVPYIWSGVCNAEKLQYTMPIIPRRADYFGKGAQIVFDVRFKLYYDEIITTNWQPLEGVTFSVDGNITVEGGTTVDNE